MRYFGRELVAASLILLAVSTAGVPSRASAAGKADVLLFDGVGTSRNDVASIETILNSSHISYSRVNSSQLNGMATSELSQYRLLIVSGGDFIDMGNSLTVGTTANVRNAVKSGSGWGDVIGKYPDGTPAIVEGAVGKGWVILSGVHAEAPASWRRGIAFGTAVSADTAYARTLIVAALSRIPLPHYRD